MQQRNKQGLSIIVPLYNEEESVALLSSRIHDAVAERFEYEIIFVDDGSTDRSWQVIGQLKQQDPERISGIRFRRNYGKSVALQRGFEKASMEYIATLDADLQDDPYELPSLIDKLEEGYDMINGWKKERKDPLSKTIPSRFFNYITSLATGIRLHDFNCGLKVYRQEVVQQINLYGELHRYVPYLVHQQGFQRIGEKRVRHHPRKYGSSKFGFARFIRGFLDLLTVIFLNHYLKRPMHFFGSLGSAFLVIGGGIVLYLVIMRLFFEVYLTGRPLLQFGILFLLLGVQFFAIGLLGELINQVNSRHDGDDINIKEEL